MIAILLGIALGFTLIHYFYKNMTLNMKYWYVNSGILVEWAFLLAPSALSLLSASQEVAFVGIAAGITMSIKSDSVKNNNRAAVNDQWKIKKFNI